MTPDGWLVIGVVVATGLGLSLTRIGADLILVGALTVLLLLGVITPDIALSGFSNPGLAAVAVLYIVVSGCIETGAANVLAKALLGRPKSEWAAQIRLMLPVAFLSAFLNNTPVVAMLVPAVQDWARRNRFSVSKLMIPLSYAAIFGGACTMIGTSTNLILAGLVEQDSTLPAIGFFEIAWLGIPSAVIGIVFVLCTSRWLLPTRKPPITEQMNLKEYAVEMLVEEGSSLVGQTIEQAGLRHLPSLYLAEIERGGSILPAVSPNERLQDNDRLVFVGMVDSVVDLYQIRGLIPAPDQVFKLDSPRPQRQLVEAVISGTSPLVGLSIRESRFRTRYDAVVIAVARAGERVQGKIGVIELHVGDTLLLEARPAFVEQHRNSRDFLLVSAIEGGKTPRHDKAGIATVILIAMVIGASLVGLSMLVAALVAAGLMIITRCTSASAARRNVDWQVLVVIGASIGLGSALEQTGAASAIAHFWIGFAGQNHWIALLAIYLITSLFTAVVTNNAAAVLMFPIAKATAMGLGVSFSPFIFTIMMAASASFATPISYQTNLMVYGPGGYRFSDYLKIGIPLNLLMAGVTMAIAPWVWPF
jgi:di/tricarboxylate transporter